MPDDTTDLVLHAFKVDWYVTEGCCVGTPVIASTQMKEKKLGSDVATGQTDPSAVMSSTPTTIEDGVSLPPADKTPMPNQGSVIGAEGGITLPTDEQQSGLPTVIDDDVQTAIGGYLGYKKACTQIITAYNEEQAKAIVKKAYPSAYEVEATAIMPLVPKFLSDKEADADAVSMTLD